VKKGRQKLMKEREEKGRENQGLGEAEQEGASAI
jgi:hypothetical protein